MDITEAKGVITELKKIFEIVRLVALENMSYKYVDDEGNLVDSPLKCYEFLEKPVMCQKCIASGTCKKDIRTEKFEFINDELYSISSKPVLLDGKKYILELIAKEEHGLGTDLAEEGGYRELIGELSRKLYIDPVTEILNRRYYEEHPIIFDDKNAVALIDVDDLGNIGETYGHAAGERIIKRVVEVVKENIRKDDIFIHFGPDEFIIMFPEISRDSFLEKMNRIRLGVAAAHTDEEGLRFTVSIGCAISENGRTISFDELDRQLYVAKRMRNTVAFKNKVLYSEGSSYSRRKTSDSGAHPPMYSVDYSGTTKQVVDTFKREYSSVFIVNMAEDRMLPCTVSTLSREAMERALNSELSYSEELEKYIENYVAEIDKDWIRRQLYLPKLKENLKAKGDIVYTYRVNIKGEEHFYRLRVAALSDTDAVIGFADKNREIVDELVMDSLMNEYNSIFVVDLKQQKVRSIKHSADFPELNIEGGNYKVMNMLPEYGLTSSDVGAIVAASPLHDIGKVAVPDSILLKPGRLTDEEFDLMKQHTTIGCDILKKAPKDWDAKTKEMGFEICRSHHERVDGKGYPEGLKGDDIPISAQIVGIADCFDALTSKRPYKAPFSREEAFRMILDGECGAFSEKLLTCFRACEEEFMKKR